MSRALEYTCAVLALSMPCASAGAQAEARQHRQPSPLAYLRRLVLPPVARLAVAGSIPKAGMAGSDASILDESLLSRACEALRKALGARLAQSGSSLLEGAGGAVPWTLAGGAGRAAPDVAAARRLVREAGADACVCAAVDRAGVRTTIVRELWIRAIVWVVPARDETARGPVFALAVARTAPRLIGKGYMRPDDRLADEAAAACAGQVYGALDRSEQSPFAADVRVAVLPAAMPTNVELRSAVGRVLRMEPVPALCRQSDVFFQPDVGPVADVCSREEVRGAMAADGADTHSIWREGGLDAEVVARLGRHLVADYVFVSRAQSISVMPDRDDANGTTAGEIAEAIVELALLRVADETILWRSVQSGSARSTMWAPSGPRPVRTREQCVLDATVTAYAYGRFSLEDWVRGRRK